MTLQYQLNLVCRVRDKLGDYKSPYDEISYEDYDMEAALQQASTDKLLTFSSHLVNLLLGLSYMQTTLPQVNSE